MPYFVICYNRNGNNKNVKPSYVSSLYKCSINGTDEPANAIRTDNVEDARALKRICQISDDDYDYSIVRVEVTFEEII